MIFVTVGTHEQPFNRLIEAIDRMKAEGIFSDEVIVQIGYSTYEPKLCEWQKLYPYDKMIELVNQARIVITHGGPSSFLMPLQIGKIPIVVPRLRKYDEHINNHQLEFCKSVEERLGNILVAEDEERLKDLIQKYEKIVLNMELNISSHNDLFNKKFQQIVFDLFN